MDDPLVNLKVDRRRAFGQALRIFRQKAALSQDELAAIAGLHRTYVGSVERGERNISILNICALSEAVRVLPSDLMRLAEQLVEQKTKTGGKRELLRKVSSSTHKDKI
jgi:transcriptional regulator with XRE-family HTH domain